MKEYLFTSEEKVKGLTAISDNVESKYLLPAIREAQDIYLREIIGDPLMGKLAALIGNGQLLGSFSELSFSLAFSQSVGVANMGLVKTSDDNVQNASYNEIVLQRDYYISRVDYYCLMLQNFLLENKADYPELSERKANQINATLKSAASCGIFLGGARGKVIRR